MLIEQRVVERVVSEFVASGELERMVVLAAEDERTAQLAQRVLASPAMEQMLVDAVESRLAVALGCGETAFVCHGRSPGAYLGRRVRFDASKLYEHAAGAGKASPNPGRIRYR